MIVAGVIFGKTQGLLRESFLERFGPLCICVVKVCLFLRESKSVSFYEALSTAYCIWSVISANLKLNRLSSSLRLFCHVPLQRDQLD